MSVPYNYTVGAPSVHNPVPSLPGLLGDIGRELSAGGIDPNIINAVLFGVVSLLAQGVADGKWPNGQTLPSGVPDILVGSSTAGKSLALKVLLAPFKRALEAWSESHDGDQRPAYFVEDVTRAALIQHLKEWPIAALFTDEGGILQDLFRTAGPTLAKLLNGESLHHARVSTGRVELVDYRFTGLLMLQPHWFRAIRSLGAVNGGEGLPTRFAYFCSHATGLDDSVHHLRMSSNLALNYQDRVTELLSEATARVHRKEPRPVLNLSPAAQRYLIHAGGEIRQRQMTYQPWQHVHQYVSRHTERTLRLAYALHIMEHGAGGEVQPHMVEAADHQMRYSIDTFALLTYQPPQLTPAESDANSLFRELWQLYAKTGHFQWRLSDIRRCAPNLGGMTKPRLDKAVAVLCGRQQAMIVMVGKVDWLQLMAPMMSYVAQ